MEAIRFFVAGEPKGQPRPRAFARGGRAAVYDPGTAEGWKGCIAAAAQKYLPSSPIEGPVSVSIDFFFPRPKRLMRKRDPGGPIPHTAKPDRDNAEKAVLDCLTQLGMWRDDAQVCDGPVRKWYHEKDGKPGAWIAIEPLTNGASDE